MLNILVVLFAWKSAGPVILGRAIELRTVSTL